MTAAVGIPLLVMLVFGVLPDELGRIEWHPAASGQLQESEAAITFFREVRLPAVIRIIKNVKAFRILHGRLPEHDPAPVEPHGLPISRSAKLTTSAILKGLRMKTV